MTRSHRAPSRKDRNHDQIAGALSSVAIVIDTHAAPEVGCDLLVLSRGRTVFVEVKDGAKPPSKRQLTPLEERRRNECRAASVDYVIARDTAEALCAIGVARCSGGYHCADRCGTIDGPLRFRGRNKAA